MLDSNRVRPVRCIAAGIIPIYVIRFVYTVIVAIHCVVISLSMIGRYGELIIGRCALVVRFYGDNKSAFFSAVGDGPAVHVFHMLPGAFTNAIGAVSTAEGYIRLQILCIPTDQQGIII